MYIQVMKSKIHRVTVTDANLNYIGSITIDQDLMDAAGIIEGERVYIEIGRASCRERVCLYV